MTGRSIALAAVGLVVVSCAQSTVSGPAPTDDWLDWTLAHSNYRPSAAARQATPAPASAFATQRAALTVTKGEIVVMEGDDKLVSPLGDGFGLVTNQAVQNTVQIARRFYEKFPDEYDEIVIFTAFPDQGSEDSVAWYLPIQQDVKGIGQQPVNNATFWGSKTSRLHGFVNMQYVGQYGNGIGQKTHWIHPVMAQEFGHRWLVNVTYTDKSGNNSGALLGRQGSHWANGVQAWGSVMDGIEWEDLTGGTFRVKAKDVRFSELDQYLMGLRAPADVQPFYLIHGLTYKGQEIDPSYHELPDGFMTKGEREDITIDQIISANGERVPSYQKSPHDFRIALVLVTAPGQTAAQVQSFVDRLEGFRTMFEQNFREYTDSRGTLCTQVSAPCDAPGVTLSSYEVKETDGNGDGILDPGETASITVVVKSTGVGDAPKVMLSLDQPNLEQLSIITPAATIGDVAAGKTATTPSPLLIKIPPFVKCGEEVVVPVTLETDGRFFPAEIRFTIGVDEIVRDTLEVDTEWKLNPDGTDTAKGGKWEIGQPKGVDALYIGVNLVTQPSEDHSPVGTKALVTDRRSGQIGAYDVDDGKTVALSPVYSIEGARDPLVTFWTWRFGYQFGKNLVEEEANDVLTTELTTDGGKTWVTVVQDKSNTQKWEKKQVRIRDHAPLGKTVQLRFTMIDAPPQSVAEAAVDDIVIWDESLVCRPDLAKVVEPPKTGPTGPTSPPGGATGPTTGGTGATAPTSAPAAQADPASGCATSVGSATPSPLLGLGLLLLLLGLRRHRVG